MLSFPQFYGSIRIFQVRTPTPKIRKLAIRKRVYKKLQIIKVKKREGKKKRDQIHSHSVIDQSRVRKQVYN